MGALSPRSAAWLAYESVGRQRTDLLDFTTVRLSSASPVKVLRPSIDDIFSRA